MRLLIFCIFLLSVNAQAETVYSVHDSDTFRLARPQTKCLQSGRKPKNISVSVSGA